MGKGGIEGAGASALRRREQRAADRARVAVSPRAGGSQNMCAMNVLFVFVTCHVQQQTCKIFKRW